jgi:uncharacterized membrane protein YidH (DUF202 family)
MIDSSTELVRERSREAADRTLMACIRTALALIGGGQAVLRVGAPAEVRLDVSKESESRSLRAMQ